MASFGDLGAGHQAVATEVAGQEVHGVARHADLVGRQGVADDRFQGLPFVEVARQGGGDRRRLHRLAQGRARAEVAGLGDDQRLAGRGVEELGDGLGTSVVGVADPDHPPAAGQGQGGGFVGQQGGIALDLRPGQLGDAKGIVGIIDHRADQLGHPLAHQAFVGAVDQGQPGLGIRPGGEGVGALGGDLHAASPSSCPSGRAGCPGTPPGAG